MLKQHESKIMTVMKLTDIVAVLDEHREAGKHVTTTGGKLTVKKAKPQNNALSTGPTFLKYLKTLLYAYVLCSMTTF